MSFGASGRARHRRAPLAWVALLATTISVVLGSWAPAEEVDKTRPVTVVVGPVRGWAPTDRIDPQRRGQSSAALPTHPVERWRRQLAARLDQPPVVDARGAIVAALRSGELAALAPDGSPRWRARLGTSAPVAPPVLTSDGSVAVIGGDGTLWLVSSRGQVRRSVDLRMRTDKAAVTPLALPDGSVVIAGNDRVVRVAADGSELERAPIAARLSGGIVPWRRGVLLTTASGALLHWRSPALPRKLGELGGSVEGGSVLVSARTVVAVIGRRELVAFDLISGETTLLLSGASLLGQIEAPVTLARDGLLLATTVAGELFAIDGHGATARRLALVKLPSLLSTDGGAALSSIFRRVATRSGPPLLAGSRGRVAFVRASGKLGLVDGAGRVQIVAARACGRPLAVLPAGPGRLLLACRSGDLVLYDDG